MITTSASRNNIKSSIHALHAQTLGSRNSVLGSASDILSKLRAVLNEAHGPLAPEHASLVLEIGMQLEAMHSGTLQSLKTEFPHCFEEQATLLPKQVVVAGNHVLSPQHSDKQSAVLLAESSIVSELLQGEASIHAAPPVKAAVDVSKPEFAVAGGKSIPLTELPGVLFRAKGNAPLAALSKDPPTPARVEARMKVAEHADTILNHDGPHAGSALRKLADKLEKLEARGVNDADQGTSLELNCSFTTIGAILGKTATEVAQNVHQRAPQHFPNADPKKDQIMMTWAQSQGVTDVNVAALDANYQVGPILELLSGHFGPGKADPDYRIDASHLVINAEKQIDVVLEDQLLAQMKEYKEGTMFAVFMRGTKPEESHWAFAEVRDEFVGAGERQPIIVFRDFQQNIPFKGKISKESYTTKASITVDQLPLGCKADTKVFVSGAFIALEPTFESWV